jgi:SAM-dependent methyltransferase
MKQSDTNFLDEVANYYSTKLAEHGETAQGVDWNGVEGQSLRFDQFRKLISGSDISINDLGCGYGALYDYLIGHYENIIFRGYDVSAEMIEAANLRYKDKKNVYFKVTDKPSLVSDYGVASGIFNVRLGENDVDWLKYIEGTLDILSQTSKKGFAFNCLTSYSDKDKKRDYLYYADPCILFDLCKKKYSRNVSLLHDYGLYEFTILVRKS